MILSELPPAAQRYGLRLTCDQIRRMQLRDLPRT